MKKTKTEKTNPTPRTPTDDVDRRCKRVLGVPKKVVHGTIQCRCGLASVYAQTIADVFVDEVVLDMIESGCGKDSCTDDVRLALGRAILKAVGKEV